ncbi:mitochondrial fission regulator 1-like [Alosa alosa]|uniref:mitochondrial fission regulator 1-like n=1 Tax=Alosa alosa TaxID=278164 RepID=UPI002015479B|nr:mitochondrial fission regulator 1-like [Alosa alosa]
MRPDVRAFLQMDFSEARNIKLGPSGNRQSEAPSGLVSHTQQPQTLGCQCSLSSLQGPTVVNDEAMQKISALETELARLRAQIAQIVLAQERHANTDGFCTQQQHQMLRRQCSLPSLQGPTVVNDEAMQKISALETELARLRAQIAQILLAQERNANTAAPPPSPHPPPPPPLPPPLPPTGSRCSAIELIRERRGTKDNSLQQTMLVSGPKQPSMLDVLKDMSKVKLRSVQRRPEEGHTKRKPTNPTDDASFIAEALKNKFARNWRREESENQGNFPEPKPKPHTDTPLFGQHMLKQAWKRSIHSMASQSCHYYIF